MNYSLSIARLRGVCLLSVLFMHYTLIFPNVFQLLGNAIVNGYYGVTAFFAVSGFLITSNILTRYRSMGKVSLRNFYVMRAARILPTLCLLIMILSVLAFYKYEGFVFPDNRSLWKPIEYAITFRYNIYYQYLGGGAVLGWAVLWSLSIEEVFYLFYPIISKILDLKRNLSLFLFIIYLYGTYHRFTDKNGITTLYDYFSCFDIIALGALSALSVDSLKSPLNRLLSTSILLIGIAIIGITYSLIVVQEHYATGPSLIGIGASMVLFASQCGPTQPRKRIFIDPLAFLGNYSYEAYMFHMTVFIFLRPLIMKQLAGYPVLLSMIIFAVIVAISFVVSQFYAEPINRAIRRKYLIAM